MDLEFGKRILAEGDAGSLQALAGLADAGGLEREVVDERGRIGRLLRRTGDQMHEGMAAERKPGAVVAAALHLLDAEAQYVGVEGAGLRQVAGIERDVI